jgi:hypothetical protein
MNKTPNNFYTRNARHMVVIHYQWLFMPVLSQLSPAEILWLDPHKPIARKTLYQQQTAAFNHFA